MFDFSFPELLLIGVIALIVIGPERMPEVARTLGKYVGRMRRFVNKVRDDIESEISKEELREALKRHADIDDVKNIINDSRYTIENEVEEARQHVVKARDEDPRGDFSQNDQADEQQELLKEQNAAFENGNTGTSDHHDHAEDEVQAAPTTTQTGTTEPVLDQSQPHSKASGEHAQGEAIDVDKTRQDDGHDKQPKT